MVLVIGHPLVRVGDGIDEIDHVIADAPLAIGLKDIGDEVARLGMRRVQRVDRWPLFHRQAP